MEMKDAHCERKGETKAERPVKVLVELEIESVRTVQGGAPKCEYPKCQYA